MNRYRQCQLSIPVITVLLLGSLMGQGMVISALGAVTLSPIEASSSPKTQRSTSSPEKKQLEDTNAARFSLPNGHQVMILPMPSAQSVVLDTWIDVGSKNETSTLNGLSHFLEHLLFKGSEGLPLGTLDAWIEHQGGMTNAATSKDFTHYYQVLPSASLKEGLDKHFKLIYTPQFPEAEVNKERGVVVEEMRRARNNLMHTGYDDLSALVFTGHPYGQSTLGPPSVIQQTPLATIRSYYQTFYQPERMLTLIAGPVDPSQLKTWMETLPTLSKAVSAAVPKEPLAFTWPALSQPLVQVQQHPTAKQPLVLAMLPPLQSNELDTLDAEIANDLYADYLTDPDVGVLTLALWKTDQPVVLALGAGMQPMRYTNVWMQQFSVLPSKEAEFQTRLGDTLATFQRSPLNKTRLETLKRQRLYSYRFEHQEPQNLTQTVGYYHAQHRTQDAFAYAERLKTFDVAKVMSLHNQGGLAWHQARWLVLQQQPLTPTIEAPWKQALQALPVIISQKEQTLSTQQTTEAPSQEAWQQRWTDGGHRWWHRGYHQPQTVSIRYTVALPTSTSPQQRASVEVLGEMLGERIAGLSAEAWQSYLKEHGLQWNVSTDADGVVLAMDAPVEEETAAWWAFSQVLERSELPESLMRQKQNEALEALQSLEQHPQAYSQSELEQRAFAGVPYGLQGMAWQPYLKRLQPKQVHQTWQWLRQQPTTLVTVGTQETLPPQRVLTSLPKVSLPKTEAFASGGKPAKPTVDCLNKAGQATSWVYWAWPAPPTGSEEALALRLVHLYMGGGMSSRLFTEVREKRSLAYEVASQWLGHRTASLWTWYAGVAPENEAKAVAVFEQLREELLASPLPVETLERLKTELLGKMAVAKNTPADWANSQVRYAYLGLPLEYEASTQARLQQLTSEQLHQWVQQRLAKDKTGQFRLSSQCHTRLNE